VGSSSAHLLPSTSTIPVNILVVYLMSLRASGIPQVMFADVVVSH